MGEAREGMTIGLGTHRKEDKLSTGVTLLGAVREFSPGRGWCRGVSFEGM